ncbi:hypothetical protein GOL29_29300 [Sinorhizobium medicae]|nr:hypothetical protein [Sinorhizobium medicae]
MRGPESSSKKEFHTDKDIKVEWTYFRGAGPALNEAVAAKQLDFFLLGDLPAIVGRSRGLEHKSYSPPRAMNRSISPCRSTAI